MNYQAIIIEDELNNAKFLHYLVDNYSPIIKVIGVAHSVEEAKKFLLNNKPDIIFLDVELGKQNAFKIFDVINPNAYQLILTTAHEEYAIDAIKISAIDYLVKPINIDDFICATQKVISNLEVKRELEVSRQATDDKFNQKQTNINKVISIPVKNELLLIKIENILYLSSNGNYTIFHLYNGEELLSSTNIGTYDDNVSFENFFRIHNSYIINLLFLKKVVKGEGYYCIMENNKSLPISRRKYPYLRNLLGN